MTFAIQLRKNTENLSQGSQTVLDTSYCVDLAALLRTDSPGLLSIGPLRLTVRDFIQRLVDTSAFEASEIRCSPHQLTLSRSSDVVGEKWNQQILVNLHVTNVSRCVSRIANTL